MDGADEDAAGSWWLMLMLLSLFSILGLLMILVVEYYW
jgi:hypothetical protein